MQIGYILAILTGIFFGLQGVAGKLVSKNFSAAFLTWATYSFTLPFISILLLIEGLPQIDWPNLIWSSGISFLINLIAWNLFFRSLGSSPLYLSMPFTSFTPLFLIPVAYFLFGELPDPLGFSGILLIIAGSYGIHFKSRNIFLPFQSLLKEKGTRLMLGVAILWSISAPVEKVAIISSSPVFYAVAIQFLIAVAYFPYIFLRHKNDLHQIPENWKILAILGLVSTLVLINQFTGLKFLEVSYIIAFKRAGVIVSVIIGFLYFGEKNFLRNLISTVLIVTGAILIIL